MKISLWQRLNNSLSFSLEKHFPFLKGWLVLIALTTLFFYIGIILSNKINPYIPIIFGQSPSSGLTDVEDSSDDNASNNPPFTDDMPDNETLNGNFLPEDTLENNTPNDDLICPCPCP